MSAHDTGGAVFPTGTQGYVQGGLSFFDACVLAALPQVLHHAAAHDEWDDINVARVTCDLAEAVVAERNKRKAGE